MLMEEIFISRHLAWELLLPAGTLSIQDAVGWVAPRFNTQYNTLECRHEFSDMRIGNSHKGNPELAHSTVTYVLCVAHSPFDADTMNSFSVVPFELLNIIQPPFKSFKVLAQIA